MAKVLRRNLTGSLLLKSKDMLARRKLLLPCLNFLLPRERVCLHNSVNHSRELSSRLINIINVAFIAPNRGLVIIAVGFGLGSNSNLGDLLWRLITYDNLGENQFCYLIYR